MGGFYPGISFDSGSRKGIDRTLGQQSSFLASLGRPTLGQRSSEFGALMPGYTSLLNSGYSPQEKSAIEQSTLGTIGSSAGAAADAASRRMARTGNAAGYGSFMRSLSRQKGQAMAQQELQNQKDFADEALRRKMIGLQGIAQLYGVDTSFLNSLNQLQNQLVGQSVGTYGIVKGHPGFGDSFMSSLGSSLGGII